MKISKLIEMLQNNDPDKEINMVTMANTFGKPIKMNFHEAWDDGDYFQITLIESEEQKGT